MAKWLGCASSLNIDHFALLYISVHSKSTPPAPPPVLTVSLLLCFQQRVINIITVFWGLGMTILRNEILINVKNGSLIGWSIGKQLRLVG